MKIIKNYRLSFEELEVKPHEIEELMGFEPGQSPEPFPELITSQLQEALGVCTIEGGFKIFDEVAVDQKEKTITLEDQVFYPGQIVVTQLKEATQAALFACTAGRGITDLAKNKSAEGDEFTAYVLDVIGSVTVDKAALKIQEKILAAVLNSGKGITDPFSPGYCNWNVAEQHKLFALLPSQFCGISLSDSSLMNPIKSVSGITGIGIHCKQKGYQCEWCNDKDCIYGRIRRQKKR